jgi:protein-S-isoprenylcysteine O-methyltransferase Ste14
VADARRPLARWRVPLGYLLAIAAIVLAAPTWRTLVAGAAVGAIGEALRVWAAGHLEKGREVTTSGPYAVTRHPLYAGSCIMGAGFAIAANSVIVAVLVFVYLAATIVAAVRSEEAHLTEKFGESYPAYREGRAPSAPRRFSLARAWRNREHRALLGFAGVFLLLAVRLWLR